MIMSDIKRCSRCVMDNSSDNTITFNEKGECNYCTQALTEIGTTTYFPNEIGEQKLKDLIAMLKKEGKGKKYDCIMGISGGLDSSYLAYLGYKWGLRILAVHIDDGYDTEISKENIKKLVKAAHIDMRVIAPDAKQFDDLTLAYMKAGVPNLAIPQDNILFAFLYDVVKESGIKYFLSGGNFALECVLQHGNTYGAYDMVNIRDIHKKFGSKPIDRLPFISQWQRVWDVNVHHINTIAPLNYVDYNKERAIRELHDFCGFTYYAAKHLENTLTKVIQLYWFYHKFGVDKRTSHLSSLIVSGQMTRQQALKDLEKPIYDKAQMDRDLAEVLPKIGLSRDEFDQLVSQPGKQHDQYKTDHWFIICKVLHKLHLIRF